MSAMLEQYVKMILTSRVYDVAVETPLQQARQLSERTGTLYCRDEGPRVKISGGASLYLEGELKI